MGVLYFGDDITGASVLWMRRMLECLGDDVATLVSEAELGPPYTAKYDVLVLRDSAWSWGFRSLRRAGLITSVPPSARARGALAAAIAADRVSVVLMHYLTLAVKYERVLRDATKPIFVHCHGYDCTWDLRRPHRPDVRVHPADYQSRVRALPDRVDFIANSNVTRERLLEIGIAEGRIHLKYLGVSVPASPPVARDAAAEPLTILYLGRLIDAKGPQLVVQAFDLACKRGLEGRLVIAGDGPMRGACETLREQSPARDRIEVLGVVDAATGERLRSEADIFTAHNRTGRNRQEEAYGVSVVEAMAAGIPVVSGRSGSLPELVDDGVHGILVEPGDIEGQADAFLRLAGDPALRHAMGRRGWERAKERFSIEGEATRLRSLLGLPSTS